MLGLGGMVGGIAGGLLGSFFDSNSQSNKASKNAMQAGEAAKNLASNWRGTMKNLNDPYISQGLSALINANNINHEMFDKEAPDPYRYNQSNAANAFNDYQQSIYQPQFQYDSMPLGADYANAMNTDQYAALMGASADAGGNLAGNIANQYTYDIADREYDNTLNNYQMALDNNQYANSFNQGLYDQSNGLQDYLFDLQQKNYGNQMTHYGANNDRLTNYLKQLNNQTNLGLGATDAYSRYGTDAIGGMIGTLSGISDQHLNNAASQNQKSGNMLGTISQIGGNLIGNFL